MNLVPEHIDEAIKHLSPKTSDEIYAAFKSKVENILSDVDHTNIADELLDITNGENETKTWEGDIITSIWQHLDNKTRKKVLWDLLIDVSKWNRELELIIKHHKLEIQKEINEGIKHLTPRSRKELEAAHANAIREIDDIYIRDDKLSYLEKYLDKDWEKVYWDAIMWISDNEFDEFCHYVIKHPEEYKE